jgi:hypothetical protein
MEKTFEPIFAKFVRDPLCAFSECFSGSGKRRCLAMVDLLALLPNNNVRRVVMFCLNECHLTLGDTERVLYDANRIMGAVNLLLEGRITADSSESPERLDRSAL